MKQKGKTATTTGGEVKPPALELSIPQQSAPPEESIFLDPRETSAWISALPLANIGETARQIYTTLVDFNRYTMPVITRAKVVEQFRPIVAYLCHNLRRHYMDMGFPLSQKAWKTIILSRELNNELATSYKIILQHMLAGESGRLDRKLLIISLHRAIHYLGQVYLQSSISYTSPPSGLWKEINLLFAFARTNRIHRVPVKMKNHDEEETSTIEERYKALMLFATATPSRLRQFHLDSIYRRTLEWASLTHFLGPNDETAQVDALNVNLGVDEHPIHNALRMPAASPQVVTLDVHSLIQKLQSDYKQVPADGAAQAKHDAGKLPRSLLRQVVTGWHSPAERQFTRTRLNFSLQVVSGLKSIHSILAQEGANDGEAPDSSSQADAGLGNILDSGSLSLMEQAQDGSHGILGGSPPSRSTGPASHGTMVESRWEVDSNIPSLSPLEMNPTEGPQGDSVTANTASEALEVTTRNESANGYCIHWSGGHQLPKAKVGELIGIGGGETHSNYSLGVIRWLHCQNQTELELGLEVMSSHIKAVTAYPAAAEGKIPLRNKKDPIIALLLDSAAQPTKGERPSLLLGSTAYASGTYLWLEESPGGIPQLIRISKLIEFSGVFARFGFEYISRDGEKKSARDTSRDEFETLWNTL